VFGTALRLVASPDPAGGLGLAEHRYRVGGPGWCWSQSRSAGPVSRGSRAPGARPSRRGAVRRTAATAPR
jgi:hypothetical protein